MNGFVVRFAFFRWCHHQLTLSFSFPLFKTPTAAGFDSAAGDLEGNLLELIGKISFAWLYLQLNGERRLRRSFSWSRIDLVLSKKDMDE
jgi:hypothetical protein